MGVESAMYTQATDGTNWWVGASQHRHQVKQFDEWVPVNLKCVSEWSLFISIAEGKTVVSLLLMQWRYHSLALSQWYSQPQEHETKVEKL